MCLAAGLGLGYDLMNNNRFVKYPIHPQYIGKCLPSNILYIAAFGEMVILSASLPRAGVADVIKCKLLATAYTRRLRSRAHGVDELLRRSVLTSVPGNCSNERKSAKCV